MVKVWVSTLAFDAAGLDRGVRLRDGAQVIDVCDDCHRPTARAWWSGCRIRLNFGTY